MSDGYKPTSAIKWFRVGANCINGERPLAQIAGYQESYGPQWFCLKQLWVSDFTGEDEEWRDVDVIY